jgi:type II secretory pathway component PulM
MNQAVSDIQQLKGSGAVGSSSANMTLAQIAESSAKRAGFRLTRFQPKDDTEAQVWLDKIAFSDLLSFLNQLEQVHNTSIETLAVNSAGEPGLVNARLKFKK